MEKSAKRALDFGEMHDAIVCAGALACLLLPPADIRCQTLSDAVRSRRSALCSLPFSRSLAVAPPVIGAPSMSTTIYYRNPIHPLHERHELGLAVRDELLQPHGVVLLYGLSGVGKTLLSERVARGEKLH